MKKTELKNMVYGVIGIKVRNSMWNANFSKYAKKNSLGEMYGTPQALGYAIKDQLNRDGDNVLYRKTLGENGVMDLKECLEYRIAKIIDDIKEKNVSYDEKFILVCKALKLADENSDKAIIDKMLKDLKIKDEKTFEENIYKITGQLKTENQIKAVIFDLFEDIMDFGTTFTAKGYTSFGVTGAVQIGQGVNKYLYTEEMISEMLTCFSAETEKNKIDAKKNLEKMGTLLTKLETAQKIENNETAILKVQKEIETLQTTMDKAKSNTLGEQILLDKAHFVYDFTINPYEYEQYKIITGFEGYMRENYEKFKSASMRAVSNLNSKAKKGCTNEFALFVETKEDTRDSIDLNCLGEYIKVDIEDDGTVVYDLTLVANVLNDIKERVESVELYYDYRIMKVIGNIENVKAFDIRTRKEIK